LLPTPFSWEAVTLKLNIENANVTTKRTLFSATSLKLLWVLLNKTVISAKNNYVAGLPTQFNLQVYS
jgi:hypothetical protein